MDLSSGDLRLDPASPCINAGINDVLLAEQDLSGKNRIYSRQVDMGAYESTLPWLNILAPDDYAAFSHDATNITVSGDCNPNTDHLTWSNTFNQASGTAAPATDGQWSSEIPLEVGTNTIVVTGFNPDADSFDDVIHVIRQGIGTGKPEITILSPADGSGVSYDTTAINVEGTLNIHVFGQLTITNTANGQGLQFEAETPWEAQSIFLAEGLNTISVHGTNLLGESCSDTVQVTRSAKSSEDDDLTIYVSKSGLHIPPFATWLTAARDIQSAVDIAYAGDCVLVTNGQYNTNGKVAPGYSLTNRVMVHKPIEVRSVNGPDSTHITGAPDPVDTFGPAAIRCVYLTSNAFLSEFTLANGHTLATGDQNTERGAGGVLLDYGGTVSNCVLNSNSSHGLGGGANLHHGGAILDSAFYNNRAGTGGGGALVEGGYLENCAIQNNATDTGNGGGLYLYDASWGKGLEITLNEAANSGGGVYIRSGGSLSNCRIDSNTSLEGGGGLMLGENAFVDRCVISRNLAGDSTTEDGGGLYIYGGTVRNSLIVANEAKNCGGGIMFGNAASNAVVEFCTIAGNHAELGGGVRFWNGTVRNSIVYDNTAWGSAPNWSYGGNTPLIEHTCTTPTNNIPGGTGCITNPPQFKGESDYHLLAGSPCIDAGTNTVGATVDLDGTPRPLYGDANGTCVADLGCYETINPVSDSDGDSIEDGWEHEHGLDLLDPSDAADNPDGDGYNNRDEFIADTNPQDANSYLDIIAISNQPSAVIWYHSSSNRLYTLLGRSNLLSGTWLEIPGQTDIRGSGEDDFLQDTNSAAGNWFYRIQVELP